ncbi:MAG: HDOD domain-containing protein [Vampirovibrionales bacterium]
MAGPPHPTSLQAGLINKILVDLIGQPEASGLHNAKLISFDAGLTSKVLRLVNSSAYGFQRQITGVTCQ